MNVQLFIPCFVDQLYPDTAFNMIKVLEKTGCTVTYNTSQTCCGQPAFNAGFWDEAKSNYWHRSDGILLTDLGRQQKGQLNIPRRRQRASEGPCVSARCTNDAREAADAAARLCKLGRVVAWLGDLP